MVGLLTSHLGAQWRSVGQTTQLALFDIENGIAQYVTYEFETRHAIMADDGKYGGESSLKAFFFTLG